MERSKTYHGISLSSHGWGRLAHTALGYFDGKIRSVAAVTYKDGGSWTYDTIEDFLADFNSLDSSLRVNYENYEGFELTQNFGNFKWVIRDIEKKDILRFETDAQEIIERNKIAVPEPPKPDRSVRVFIGHGRAPDWRDLKDHLSDKHDLAIECYETGSRAGHSIRDVLDDMMNASNLAILVHTPEDELADGNYNSRPNVIHETGLFQGKLGFSRAVVLLKNGTQEFTNLSGIQQIRYADIKETYGDVLAWIKRETQAAKE